MYDEEEDYNTENTDSFKSRLLTLYSKSQVKDMLKEAILETAEENDWNSEDNSNEFKNEKAWYEDQAESLGYIAENNVIEKIIEETCEELDLNVSRLDGDLYENFQEIIKEEFPELDVESDRN